MITTGEGVPACSEDQRCRRASTTDSYPQLDIRELARLGLLADNVESFQLTWPAPGDDAVLELQVLRGDTAARASGLKVSYRAPGSHGGNGSNVHPGDTGSNGGANSAGAPVNDNIAIDYTACNLGGDRPWFRCPGCATRVAILYLRSSVLRCRRCHGLVYRSTRESPIDRAARRVGKLRAKLGDHQGADPFGWRPVPDRPPGMHSATYNRLGVELLLAEDRYRRLVELEVMKVPVG